MPHRSPPKPPPIEVVDVGEGRVRFLRPFEWLAVALRSFRERPLPSTYETSVQPVFDLFGNQRIEQVQYEQVNGTLALIEVLSAKVPADKYRFYLSMAYSHDDPTSRLAFAERQVSDGGTFPFAPLDDLEIQLTNHWRVVRNVTVPPEGRIGAQVNSLAVGARITLRSLFVELDVGEPHGDIS